MGTEASAIKPVSRKPPIDKNKATYKMQAQKPAMQGWLYKKRYTNTSSNNKVDHLNRSSSWKKYWCVLTKDYITFYKNPDERVPKDFLLLKDFDITKELLSSRKFGFILFDRSKQSTHEFYTEHSDEFTEWFQVGMSFRLFFKFFTQILRFILDLNFNRKFFVLTSYMRAAFIEK